LGLAQLRISLARHGSIALDTSIFIYELETNPRYVALADAIFQWIEQSGHRAITSTITMTELLVQPYREFGQPQVDAYYTRLATYPNLEWVDANIEIAGAAAKLRAAHRMSTPDALQAATAIRAQATALVTNDPIFKRVSGFEALVLDDLL
jgi:predicted nucleic acid-binding protein